jgi:hypothetical protein
MKFDENPSSRSRVFQNGPTERRKEGQKDMTKLMVEYCNFASAAKKENLENLAVDILVSQNESICAGGS